MTKIEFDEINSSTKNWWVSVKLENWILPVKKQQLITIQATSQSTLFIHGTINVDLTQIDLMTINRYELTTMIMDAINHSALKIYPLQNL
jgi:hypothetical protein